LYISSFLLSRSALISSSSFVLISYIDGSILTISLDDVEALLDLPKPKPSLSFEVDLPFPNCISLSLPEEVPLVLFKPCISLSLEAEVFLPLPN